MIDQTIKQVAVEVITQRLDTYKGNKFKVVEKYIPLDKTDQRSIDNAFVTAYHMPGYVNGSAYIVNTEYDEIELYYEVQVETTKEERQKEVIDRINKGVHFKLINDKLTSIGYKRTPVWSNKLKEFDDTTIYDMYLNDQDRLAMYYQLYFTKG